MNQLKEISRIIEVIQSESIRLEEERAGIKDVQKKASSKHISLFDFFLPKTMDVIEEYQHKYKCTYYQARNAFRDAAGAEEGYISTYNDEYKERDDTLFDTYVEVNPAGRTLNSKIFKFIPTGRYNKWLGDNSNLVTFVFGTLVGFIAAIATIVIKTVFKG